MTNNVLGFDDLPGGGPAQPEVFLNAATDRLAQALGGQITIDFASDADYTLVINAGAPENDEWSYQTIRMTDTGVNLTAARNVDYPDVDTTYTGPSRVMFVFQNDTAQSLTIRRVGQTGVTVAAGQAALVRHTGSDIAAIVSPLP